MNDNSEFFVFNLILVAVYVTFLFDLDTICIVLVNIDSTSG